MEDTKKVQSIYKKYFQTYMHRCNWNPPLSKIPFHMGKQVIFEVKTSWGPESHIKPGHLATVALALDSLHPPAGALVALPLGLHEHLHVPHHVDVSLMKTGPHQLKLFQGKLKQSSALL